MGARTRPRSGVIFPNTALRLSTRAPSAAEASLAAKKQNEQAGADHQGHDAMVTLVTAVRIAAPAVKRGDPESCAGNREGIGERRTLRLKAARAKVCQEKSHRALAARAKYKERLSTIMTAA
jgi:hypothetical protein